MDYCLVVKESCDRVWIVADEQTECLVRCGNTCSGIRRTTEHEVMQGITEGEGGRSMTEKKTTNLSGGDAFMGNTRTHPEHDG